MTAICCGSIDENAQEAQENDENQDDTASVDTASEEVDLNI